MVEEEKGAKVAMKRYKSSKDFVVEKAREVADFHNLEEFFADYQVVGQEAFEKGFKLGKLEHRTQVMDHYLGPNLDFLDEGESEGEHSVAVVKATLVEPINASESVPAEPSIMSKPASASPTIEPRSSSTEGIATLSEDAPTIVNLQRR